MLKFRNPKKPAFSILLTFPTLHHLLFLPTFLAYITSYFFHSQDDAESTVTVAASSSSRVFFLLSKPNAHSTSLIDQTFRTSFSYGNRRGPACASFSASIRQTGRLSGFSSSSSSCLFVSVSVHFLIRLIYNGRLKLRSGTQRRICWPWLPRTQRFCCIVSIGRGCGPFLLVSMVLANFNLQVTNSIANSSL